MHLYRGAILTPQEKARGGYTWEQPRRLGNERLQLARTPQHGWCWVCGGKPLSIQDAAAYLMDKVVDVQQRAANERFVNPNDES